MTPKESEARTSEEYWDWDLITGICDRSGVGVIGEFDRQAIRALRNSYESLSLENKRLQEMLEIATEGLQLILVQNEGFPEDFAERAPTIAQENLDEIAKLRSEK